MPLIVRVLAGNVVTSTTILSCLNTVDARHLRQLHPAVASVVVAVPWCDTGTKVVDAVRWRAALPAAVGTRLARSAGESLTSELATAALGGLTRLDLRGCPFVNDEPLRRLPISLRALNVRECEGLTAAASVAHLSALTSLDCSRTRVVDERADGLPPSLLELDIGEVRELNPRVSLAHLHQLRVLRADGRRLVDATLASLPTTLEELDVSHCEVLTPAASFAHLTALRKLNASHSTIGDASLASMPPSLVSLDARGCANLTPAAALPHLPVLRLLDVSWGCAGGQPAFYPDRATTSMLLRRDRRRHAGTFKRATCAALHRYRPCTRGAGCMP